MRHSHACDPNSEVYLYEDLVSGDGEKAAYELLPLVKKFVCKKFPEFFLDAEEIAIDVFERVCEKIHTFKQDSKLSTWVCGIAWNVLQERLREKNRQCLFEELNEDFVADDLNPEEQLIDKTTREVNYLLVKEALETLTERQRNVFTLKHSMKLTSAEIGGELGMSAGAVRSALADANVRIERWRKEKGYSP